MQPTRLDHVAIYVQDRPALTNFLVDELGLRVVDQTDLYSLVGPSAQSGKLTLFDAPAGTTPEPQVIVNVILADVEGGRRPPLQAPEGLTFTFIDVPAERHAVVGLTLRSADPVVAAARYVSEFGFESLSAHPNVASVGLAGATLTLVREQLPRVEQTMLYHLGLLVDAVDPHIDEARERGIPIVNVVDAANTRAVFVTGPDDVCVEYVEHKPEFALT